jgi:hypothetical protein
VRGWVKDDGKFNWKEGEGGEERGRKQTKTERRKC